MPDDTLVGFADAVEAVRQELKFWTDTLLADFHDDPVFEGMVRQFLALEETLRTLQFGVNRMLAGYRDLVEGIECLSQSVINGVGHLDVDKQIKSDAMKLHETCTAVTRQDAPHSAFSKLQRDLAYNVSEPLVQHIRHIESLKEMLSNRKRLFMDYQFARRELQAVGGSRLARRSVLEAQANAAEKAFLDADRPLFEWLMMYEEYKNDLMDSFLQTLKYLNFEFLASAGQAWKRSLPEVMEFRPLVEMTPRHLQPLVDMEIERQAGKDATSRILERMDDTEIVVKDTTPVDFLSLQILTTQGFSEELATKALRECAGDTQAALDWLLGGCVSLVESNRKAQEEAAAQVKSSVRIPTTIKWTDKLNEARSRRKLEKEAENVEGEPVKPPKEPSKRTGVVPSAAFDPWSSLRLKDDESSDDDCLRRDSQPRERRDSQKAAKSEKSEKSETAAESAQEKSEKAQENLKEADKSKYEKAQENLKEADKSADMDSDSHQPLRSNSDTNIPPPPPHPWPLAVETSEYDDEFS